MSFLDGSAERLAAVLAALGMSLGQLNFLREAGRAEGKPSVPPVGMPDWEGLRMDRPLRSEMDRIARAFLRE